VASDDPSDRMLLGRVGGGDATALEELYRRYSKPVGAFLYRMSWDRELAEDCLQEAFLRVWRSARNFRGESKVATWIFQIAKNHWLNVREKQSRHAGKLEAAGAARAEALEAPPEPLQAIASRELGAKVRAAVDDLDESHRMVFVLAHYEGMRYREIGEVLGVPVGTVKSRMAASERKLRSALAPYLDAEVVR